MTINGTKIIEDYSRLFRGMLLKIYNQAYEDCAIAIKDTINSNFNDLNELSDIMVKIDELIENTDNSESSLLANTVDWEDIARLRENLSNKSLDEIEFEAYIPAEK